MNIKLIFNKKFELEINMDMPIYTEKDFDIPEDSPIKFKDLKIVNGSKDISDELFKEAQKNSLYILESIINGKDIKVEGIINKEKTINVDFDSQLDFTKKDLGLESEEMITPESLERFNKDILKEIIHITCVECGLYLMREIVNEDR